MFQVTEPYFENPCLRGTDPASSSGGGPTVRRATREGSQVAGDPAGALEQRMVLAASRKVPPCVSSRS